MSPLTQDTLVLIGIYGIAILGLDLIVGYARIFSINQGLLFGVGAFSYAYCVNTWETTNLFVAALLGMAIASVISLLASLVSLRLEGDYFLVASFGVQLIGLQVIYNWQSVSGGGAGIFGLPFPTVFGWSPVTIMDYLGLTAVVTAVVYGIAALVLLSPFGRVVRAMGHNESALAAAGLDPLRVKISTFMLGGALAALAGVLYAGYLGIAQVNDFSIDISIALLAMVAVGGAGRVIGGLIGAVFFVLLPQIIQHAGIDSSYTGPAQAAVYGAALVLVMLFVPNGLSGVLAGAVRRVVGLARGRSAVKESL